MTACEDAYELVDLELIDPDPDQVRKSFTGIRELADTIKQNGLIQNLVLRRPTESENNTGRYFIVAGERRQRALLLLKSEGDWNSGVFCLIKGQGHKADNIFLMLVENDQREPIPPWRTGFKYQELLDFGFTQGEVAARAGKNNSHVSVCLNISRGIHPNVIRVLDRVPNTLSLNKLLAISKLLGADFEPDLPKQMEVLTAALKHKARKTGRPRENIPERERVVIRYHKLKAGRVKIPPNAKEFFDALMNYLAGTASKVIYNGSEIEL